MSATVQVERDQIVSRLLRLEPELRALGVTRMAMFGSRSRGDHRPDSDLDLLIDVEKNRKFSLLDLVGVSHVIGDSIGVPANIIMRRSLEPRMAATIQRDIVEVF